MQTVDFISDVPYTGGTIGYSILYNNWTGSVDKKTVLFIRDSDGLTQTVLLVPAETVRGAF